MLLGFIVVAERPDKSKQYLAIDEASGGYPYWSGLASSAQVFPNFEAAKRELSSTFFITKSKMSDGSIHPPMMLYSAIGLCHNKPSGSVEIKICKLSLDIANPVESKSYFEEIKEPKGYTY